MFKDASISCENPSMVTKSCQTQSICIKTR
jgi:hypothetical protein